MFRLLNPYLVNAHQDYICQINRSTRLAIFPTPPDLDFASIVSKALDSRKLKESCVRHVCQSCGPVNSNHKCKTLFTVVVLLGIIVLGLIVVILTGPK